MTPARPDSGDPVTVLVFKDNYASRSFQFPLGWFSRLGILLGTAVLATTGSTGAAIYWFVKAQRLGPERVQDLEQETRDLRLKLASATQASGVNPLAQASPVAAAAKPIAMAPPQVQPEAPAPALPGPIRLANFAQMAPRVANFPMLRNTGTIPDLAKLSFRLSALQATWKGHTLQVHSSIQYIANDGGNQQGRIVILARGPESLLAYPRGVLDTAHSGSLINPDRGEFFSVSRMRPIQADFGPLEPKGSVSEVTILILNLEGQILYQERAEIAATVQNTAQTTAPAASHSPQPRKSPTPGATP